jgi:hypothetical protein
MATPDEILQSASDIAESGVKETQIGDKKQSYFSPKELIELADLVSAKTAPGGPFVRIGLRGRVC